ncbi:short-chain dehydrogenase [Rhodococcus sp. EPR-157]|uniref:SDR family oxidoreductase n=1 Tax=Rhodococcus sp. EPR-157 TaxID=1813677 RepID=UPI0007BBF3E8|nr:SDR family oxidoreductase [Rhodococcus sp. EPR-157]KZF09424.1 short-chain dehydrogenase [Rhodococcus sp. EPR-157]
MAVNQDDSGRVTLVTGASRGIGAEIARLVGAVGDTVVVNYREKRPRAIAVAAEIERAGGRAHPIGADLSDEQSASEMIDDISRTFGRLDVLILNASGGLERGADPDYAMRLNRDAQVRLVELAMPLMKPGSRVVFVTSHQSHFYGQKPVPENYQPIAQSKRAGEDALRERIPELLERGITLTVVSGDMIDGTIIVRLLERRDPDAVSERREHGALPTIEEFASVVVDASIAQVESGHTFYVGGDDYLS